MNKPNEFARTFSKDIMIFIKMEKILGEMGLIFNGRDSYGNIYDLDKEKISLFNSR